MQGIKNEAGQNVYPSKLAGIIDDANAVFDTDTFEKLKNPTQTPENSGATDPASGTDTRTGGQPAPKGDAAKPDENKEPEIDYTKYVKEKTGGKYEKLEDLIAKAEAGEKPLEFANETSKKLFESLKGGKEEDVFNFLYQNKILSNTDKLSDEEKVKLKMQLENPDWSQEDVADEFERKYGLKVDQANLDANTLAKEKRAVERLVKKEAADAAEFFAKAKEELKLPELSAPVDPKMEQYSALEKREQELADLSVKFIAAVEKDIPNFKSIDLSVNDKDVQFTHKFDIEDSERTEIADKAKNYWENFQSRYFKDGVWDMQKLAQNEYIADNLPKITKSIVTRAQALAKVENVMGIANVTSTKVDQPNESIATAAEKADKKRFISM
jgi:hypothetical protein